MGPNIGNSSRLWRVAIAGALLSVMLSGIAGPMLGTTSTALAAPVTGRIELPPNGVGAAPQRTKGFLPRRDNPFLPTRANDPMPRLVVVLEGDAPPPASIPQEVSWDYLGQSFSRAVFATRLNSTVVIRNRGRTAHVLVCIEEPQLLEAGTINPTGTKSLRASKAGLFSIVDNDLPFLGGKLLVLESPYFAMVGSDGKFEIPDVPPGRYKVRIWYDTSWVERQDEPVSVGTNRVDLTLRLPATLGQGNNTSPGTPAPASPTPSKPSTPQGTTMSDASTSSRIARN